MSRLLTAAICVALGLPIGAGFAGLVMMGAITRDNAPFAVAAVIGIVALVAAVWQIVAMALDGRRLERMAETERGHHV